MFGRFGLANLHVAHHLCVHPLSKLLHVHHLECLRSPKKPWFRQNVDDTEGGIRMELVPMKTHAASGQVVNFACAYFSTERLEIDIQPVGGRKAGAIAAGTSTSLTSQSKMLMLGPPVRDMLDRFPWGSRRSLALVIEPDHRQVKCRVTNKDGLVLGELTALVQPAGVAS